MMAYLYHDGLRAKRISFKIEEKYDSIYERMEISSEIAEKFISGENDIRKWYLFNLNGVLTLRERSEKTQLNHMDEKFSLVEKIPTSDLYLSIDIHRERKKIVFCLNSDIQINSTINEIPFFITKRNDPSHVLSFMTLNLSDLIKTKVMSFKFSHDIELDFYTRRIFPSYKIRYVSFDESLKITLPIGHYVDLIKFSHDQINSGLQAIVREKSILFNLVGNEIETYDRSMTNLKLLFSVPNDPSMLLYATSIEIDNLQNGCILDLPDILRKQSFDLWSELFYHDVCILDER